MAVEQTGTGTTTTNEADRARQQSLQGQSSQQSHQDRSQQDKPAPRQDTRLGRPGTPALMSPFSLLQRFFSEDIATLFGASDPFRRELVSRTGAAGQNLTLWLPKIDVVHADNELVIRADLPGVNSDEVNVDVSDDAVTISGVRQQEHAEEHGNVYRIERTSGSFFREIPLPEGAIVDRATATFREGVLGIRVPAPSEQVSRGRRLEISKGDASGARDAGK